MISRNAVQYAGALRLRFSRQERKGGSLLTAAQRSQLKEMPLNQLAKYVETIPGLGHLAADFSKVEQVRERLLSL